MLLKTNRKKIKEIEDSQYVVTCSPDSINSFTELHAARKKLTSDLKVIDKKMQKIYEAIGKTSDGGEGNYTRVLNKRKR